MKAEALHVLCNPADPLTPAVFGVQMADSLRKLVLERQGTGPSDALNIKTRASVCVCVYLNCMQAECGWL